MGTICVVAGFLLLLASCDQGSVTHAKDTVPGIVVVVTGLPLRIEGAILYLGGGRGQR